MEEQDPSKILVAGSTPVRDAILVLKAMKIVQMIADIIDYIAIAIALSSPLALWIMWIIHKKD